jgi:hypothetical protein
MAPGHCLETLKMRTVFLCNEIIEFNTHINQNVQVHSAELG